MTYAFRMQEFSTRPGYFPLTCLALTDTGHGYSSIELEVTVVGYLSNIPMQWMYSTSVRLCVCEVGILVFPVK